MPASPLAMNQYPLEAKLAAFFADYVSAAAPVSLLAAVSGGADSMALLYALARLRDTTPAIAGLHVGHINHQLRGKASDADAVFVAEHATQLGLACTIEKADVALAMTAGGESLETAARQERYRLLSAIAKQANCSAIALAHTADDQAETVLHRLIRGTGLRGLAGISPCRRHEDLTLWRPLLAVSRREVEDYLASRGVPYRQDVSNDCLDHTRNRLRHELLPLLRANYNPNINDCLTQLAAIARDAHELIAADTGELLDALVKSSTPQRLILHRPKLAALGRIQQVQVLQACMEQLGIGQRAIDFGHLTGALALIASAESAPTALNWPGDWRLSADGDNLIVQHCPPTAAWAADKLPPVALTIPGETALPPGYLYLDTATGQTRPLASVTIECRNRASVRDDLIFANPDVTTAWLDKDALTGGKLLVRTRHEGDRFRALGAAGSKTLGDVLTDRKAPTADRDRLALLCDSAGIAWLPGSTLADRVKVTTATTHLLRVAINT